MALSRIDRFDISWPDRPCASQREPAGSWGQQCSNAWITCRGYTRPGRNSSTSTHTSRDQGSYRTRARPNFAFGISWRCLSCQLVVIGATLPGPSLKTPEDLQKLQAACKAWRMAAHPADQTQLSLRAQGPQTAFRPWSSPGPPPPPGVAGKQLTRRDVARGPGLARPPPEGHGGRLNGRLTNDGNGAEGRQRRAAGPPQAGMAPAGRDTVAGPLFQGNEQARGAIALDTRQQPTFSSARTRLTTGTDVTLRIRLHSAH